MPKYLKKSQQPQRKSDKLQVPTGHQPQSFVNFVHPNEDPQDFRAAPSFVHPPQHFVPRISPSHSLEHLEDDSKLPSFSELVASLSATQLSPHPSPLHSPSPSPRHSSHRPSFDLADRHISASSSPRRDSMRDSPYGTPVCLSPETTPRGKMEGGRSPLTSSRGSTLPAFESRPFPSSSDPPQFVLSDPPLRSSSFDKTKRGSAQRPPPIASPPFLSPDITPTVSAHGTPKQSPFISPETTPRGMSLDAGDPRYAPGRPYLPDLPLPRSFFSQETTARILDSSNRSARTQSPNRGTYPFANESAGFPYSPPDSNSTFVYPPEHNSRIKSPTRGRSFDPKGSR